MNTIVIRLLFISSFMVLDGCLLDVAYTASTKQQAINEVKAPYMQAAITVNISATPDLNALDDIANSCSLLVIQAEKPSVLDKILNNPSQLKTLFSGSSEDEILKIDRYSVMPSQQTTLHIDRTENTRYIAIVAGYYPFPKKQHMSIVRIPVTTSSKGLWTKSWYAEMAPLIINISLGSQSITNLTTSPSQSDSEQVKGSEEPMKLDTRTPETGVKENAS